MDYFQFKDDIFRVQGVKDSRVQVNRLKLIKRCYRGQGRIRSVESQIQSQQFFQKKAGPDATDENDDKVFKIKPLNP